MAKIDLTGQRFGKLVVKNESGKDRNGNITWLCLCDCGNEKIISGNCLRRGITQSCGCSKKSSQIIDITGNKYGRLTVNKYVGKTKSRCTLWECKCDCGNIIIAKKSNLISGNTKSCGCLGVEIRTKHGGSKSRIYHVWTSMKQRCYNPKNKEYNNYGGRGITVCDEWLDFKNFYEWALANGFKENASKGQSTIDRINVNEGYAPNNCRWVDMVIQSNNRRDNRNITFNGRTQTMSQWAREIGIKVNTLQSRIDVHHWSEEKALTTPVKTKKKKG